MFQFFIQSIKNIHVSLHSELYLVCAVKKIRNMLNFFADNHIIEKKIGQVIEC